MSGTLPDRPAVGSVVVDAAGSKLDYYLERGLRYAPGCDAGPSTLTNAAPPTGLPDDVTPAIQRRLDPGGSSACPCGSAPPRHQRIE